MSITVTDVLSVLRDFVDVLLVWFVIYYILKNIKNNIKLSLIFKGLVFIVALYIISDIFGFVTIGVLLDYILQWGPIALIVIFQPEIRTILRRKAKNTAIPRSERVSYGLCYICGKNELVKGKKVCASCYEVRYKSISKIMHMSKEDKNDGNTKGTINL